MGRGNNGVRSSRPNNSVGRLSELAQDALDYYVDGNAYDLNGALRRGERLDDEQLLLQRGLDEATSKPLSAQILYRTVSPESIFGADELDGAPITGIIRAALTDGIPDSMKEFHSRAMSGVKSIYTDKGYMSASKSAEEATSFGSRHSVTLRLSVPKGVKGIDVGKTPTYRNIGNNSNEAEVLLQRGLSYKLGRMYVNNGRLFIDATVLKKK